MRTQSNVKVNILDLSTIEENALTFINENLLKDKEQATGADVFGGTHGVVETDEGIYYLCSEGVGNNTPISEDNPIVFDIYHRTETGIGIFPSCSYKLRIDKLDEHMSDSYVPLNEFIRSFGARLDDNFYQWERKLANIAVEVN